MAKFVFNTRRRVLAGMVAAGFVAPRALAQPEPPELPECQTSKFGTGQAGAVGERYEARVFTNAAVSNAVLAPQTTVRLEGFSTSRFAIKLVATSNSNGEAKGLALRLPGLQQSAQATIRETSFAIAIEGKRVPGFTGVGIDLDLVIFSSVEEYLPQSFETLTDDILVAVYLPGRDRMGQPDQTLLFEKDRIGEATRLAQAELVDLRAAARRQECTPKPPGRSPCFLTTAAADMIGLGDQCWELRTLRRFRDGWLTRQSGGAEQIAEYYRRAPFIAAQLSDDPRRLARLYWSDILPSAIAAQVGLNRLARALYCRMMKKVADLDQSLAG